MCSRAIPNGELLEGFYSLIGLWRKLVELSSDEQLEVDAYNESLGEFGEDESEDAANVFWAVGRLFELQVRGFCGLVLCYRRVHLNMDFQAVKRRVRKARLYNREKYLLWSSCKRPIVCLLLCTRKNASH